MRVLRTQKWPLSDTIKFKITQIHFFRVTFFDVFSSVLPSSWLFMLLNVLMEDVLLWNSIGGSWGPRGGGGGGGGGGPPPPPPPLILEQTEAQTAEKNFCEDRLPPHPHSDFLEPISNNFYLEHCHFF